MPRRKSPPLSAEETRANRLDGLHRARDAGKFTGPLPYGFMRSEDGTRLEPNPAEAAIMARAAELREEGLSLRTIGCWLALEGRVSRSGRPFQAQQIKAMLGNNANSGVSIVHKVGG